MVKITLHTTPGQEKKIRTELGIEIPVYPETGEVKYKGRVVGHVDNFSGIIIEDQITVMKCLMAEERLNLAIWNKPSELEFPYRILDEKEEKEFRAWARENFHPGHMTISECWHPIVQEECQQMNDERFTAVGDAIRAGNKKGE